MNNVFSNLSALNIDYKKLIIILIIVITILLSTIFFISNINRPTENKKSSNLYTSESQNRFPTGVLPNNIAENELDIISISPVDGDNNVSLNTKLEIKFSKDFIETEIDFNISPKTFFSIKKDGNNLIITPDSELIPGTLYTFSVKMLNQPEKIRLYRFVTRGEPNPILPDTREEAVVNEYINLERTKYPDIFVANNTPFENEYFRAISDYETNVPAHYYLIITPKVNNLEIVKANVNVWLQTLGLTDEQISNFDIRYE
jgi:hypothetical protein